jgi:DNA damage-binding protein 1
MILRTSALDRPLFQFTVPSAFLLRSLLAARFSDGSSTLFVGLGDGSIVSYAMDLASERMIREDSRKAITVGTRPVGLDLFQTPEGPAVFASSDSPTIISRSNGRFNYASVNLRNAHAFATLNSAAFPDALVLVTPDTVRIGRIEGTQGIHIRTILLGADQPRRIAWSPALKAYGLLCIREELDKSTGAEVRTSSFKIVNETFDILFDYALDDEEQGMAVKVVPLGSPAVDHFVIGCSTTLPNEKQSKRGRILAFGLTEDANFKKVGHADAKGAPYALASVSNGRLAATINAEVGLCGASLSIDDESTALHIHSRRW